MDGEEAAALAERLLAGDRRALARAITLVESTRADHREAARALLSRLPPREPAALRVGLSGTPGVGKSSFIEALGLRLAEAGGRLAVLAVDPSSARSGGSILGDKTRMERLARAPGVFIRPSPSQAALGGVGRRTRETILVVEAWGAETVIVETVGVGQSETLVAEMTDVFVLLLAPAGGDELQGVKRGVMEMADLILVNKADGGLEAAAMRTRADYAGALRLMRRKAGDPEGFPSAACVSALTGKGLDEAWADVLRLAAARREGGAFAARRRAQAERWFAEAIETGLLARLAADPALSARRGALARAVGEGRVAPDVAAEALLDEIGALGRRG
ncbi:methylmalonyl Co-A mutase-associated GTPase MeaB [Amaricoccus sp.]|uniref:methylmalonyl Co-A mutase-associated GTPase MeaB n=1 Tax=Amaricoccus sp. TaxID=1872485 RepID=UPI001B684276|nr:methylmalonyl Co-A mutase-associated GTPase MeaB [Amaricoccus sp.]MBP7003652.1 methylmalonyl Co-A mutase-associated GTPase MeaB [Amaricoccus sp.]